MLFSNKRIFALVIAIFIGVFSFCFSAQNAYAAKSSAKTQTGVSGVKISPIDFEKNEKLSALELLNLIIEQENALSAVFIIHGKFEYFNRENIDEEGQERLNIGGIEFASPQKDDMYVIVNPKTDLYTYQSNLAFDSFKMNDKYINEKFSKSLSKPWKRYLYLSAKNSEPCAADVDGYNIDKKTAAEWIKSWSEFLALYPDFPKNNDIQEVIDFVKEQFSENEETE